MITLRILTGRLELYRKLCTADEITAALPTILRECAATALTALLEYPSGVTQILARRG